MRHYNIQKTYPDSKVYGADMGPIWGRQDPGGPHVGPINFTIWVGTSETHEIIIEVIASQWCEHLIFVVNITFIIT